MAKRNIIKIDEAKCNGCGLCVTACAEGAIEIVDGKARLVSETYCDGLGACLGHCPQDAIAIEEREAAAFDEAATEAHLTQQKAAQSPCLCPGMQAKQIRREKDSKSVDGSSQLQQWPVQLSLVSAQASYFANADLLLVADCVPFAMGDFHARFLKGKAIAVGCPKLDDAASYVEKLRQILTVQNINSLTVVHMEVPCCSGLTRIASQAIQGCGRSFSYEDVTIGLTGEVLRSETIHV